MQTNREVMNMYEINKQNFGAFLARLRKEKGMTQKGLAQKLYISDKAVSKWETGVSIPDVALLIPLGEILGVTVTELLKCRRMEHTESMTTVQVEQIVQTTIRMNDEDDMPQKKATRIGVYLGCVIGAVMELAFWWSRGFTPDTWSKSLQLSILFGIIFGGYFMIFAQAKLPPYHDQYRINGMYQGVFRMHLPGVALTNHNWPHILKVGRIWSMSFLLGFPMAYFLLASFAPRVWAEYETFLMLVFLLGGLLLPIYYVARKYE